MRDRIIFSIVFIVLVCLVIYGLTSLHTTKQSRQSKQSKETFVDAVAKPEYINAVFKDKGVEPCRILSTNSYMSSNYIDTLRIQEWKPAPSDPKYAEYVRSQSNNEYCFFFNDNDKRILTTADAQGYAPIVDPLANIDDCSKANKLFKDIPFIADAFESTGYDRTHNLPYKKCVLKIDKNYISSNPDAPDLLWQTFSGNNAFCEGMANTLQAEANSYINKAKELDAKIQPYRNTYTTTQSLSNLADSCDATTTQLTNQIDTSQKQLTALQAAITASNERYGGSLTSLRSQLSGLTTQVNNKTSELTSLQNQLNFVVNSNIGSLTASTRAITQQRNDCRLNHRNTTTALTNARSELDALNLSYRQLAADQASCEQSLRDLATNIENQKPQLQDIQQKLASTRDRLKTCSADQSTLTKEEEFWRNRLQKTQDSFDKCNKIRSELEAQIASLKQTKQSLITEIEEIKRRCRDDQSQFNMATVNIHRESAKEIVSTEQQRCAASIAMRKRRVELENEIAGILSNANSCDRIVAQCKCFKRVATFAWNDYGLSGSRNRFNTTSGRIDEIRKNLAAAPFIKFTDGARNSAAYRVTKTRRKKGGGSYIDVAGNYAPNDPAPRTAIMLAQV